MRIKQIVFTSLISLILFLGLAACGSSEPGAEEVYWDYWQACEENKYGTAEGMLSESAREKAAQVGVCGFTHDYINIIELARGGPRHTFDTDPELSIEEEHARLMWIDDQGTITIVLLLNVDGIWMIEDVIWST